jgi:hypothetical protein
VGAATIDVTVTLVGAGPTSVPAIGPTGTAPGLNFIQPAEPAIDDSSNTTTFGWPLGFAAVILLVLFTSVLIRARRARGTRS